MVEKRATLINTTSVLKETMKFCGRNSDKCDNYSFGGICQVDPKGQRVRVACGSCPLARIDGIKGTMLGEGFRRAAKQN